ncbi:hypothetical protein IAU60_001226 [Kwoniella sp. DSM 27419]
MMDKKNRRDERMEEPNQQDAVDWFAHDSLLLTSPWLGRKDQHGRTHLVKYAEETNGTGYTTDFDTIHLSSALSPGISTALWDGTHPDILLAQELIQASEVDDPEAQADVILQRLREMLGEGWDETHLAVEDEAEGLVDDFGWRFPMVPVDPGQTLSLISRHLLQPLTSIIAQDRSIPIPTSSRGGETASRLICDPEISRAIKRSTQAAGGATPGAGSKSQHGHRAIAQDDEGSPTPRKPGKRSASPRHEPVSPSGPKGGRTEQAIPSDSASSPLRSSPPPSPSVESTPASDPEPKTHRGQRQRAPPQAAPHSSQPSTDVPSSSPSVGSAMDFRPPTQTPKTQSSQPHKSKREREKEEEEEVERKMEAMRKRMEVGGKGKLAKRRLAR